VDKAGGSDLVTEHLDMAVLVAEGKRLEAEGKKLDKRIAATQRQLQKVLDRLRTDVADSERLTNQMELLEQKLAAAYARERAH
jgi:hypothetical protein